MRLRWAAKLYLTALVGISLGAGLLPTQTRVEYQTTSDWGTGFQSQVTIHNDAAQPIGGWAVSFDFPRNIDTIWEAGITSHQDAHYAIQPAGWNTVIPDRKSTRLNSSHAN